MSHPGTIHHEHADEKFIRLNRGIFLEIPQIRQYGSISCVQFKITEDALNTKGFWTLNQLSNQHVSNRVRCALILVANNESPAYPYAVGFVQKAIDEASLAAVSENKSAANVVIALADYDSITGFTGKKKVLEVEIEFYNSTIEPLH